MQRIDIANRADLILEVNSTHELHVSFEYLQKCKYFELMFASRYMEGISFQASTAGSATEPHRQSIEEDDTDAVTLVCAALHGRYDLIPREPDIDTVEAFASLVDKYARTAEVEHAAGMMLDGVLATEPNAVGSTLESAYSLDHAASFSKITDFLSKYMDITETQGLECPIISTAQRGQSIRGKYLCSWTICSSSN